MEIGGFYGNGECVGGQILIEATEEEINWMVEKMKEKKRVKKGLVVGFGWVMLDEMDLPPSTADVEKDRWHDRAL